jgi:type II secretory pathway component PulJ
MTAEERRDRRWKFLATLVEDLERNTSLSGNPEETGESLGYSPNEIREYVEYWLCLGRLKRGTEIGMVSITGQAIADVRALE